MTQPATIPLGSSQVKSQAQIRDDILRTLANHLRAIGIPNPNVGVGSDYYGIATGVANEICVGLSNGVVNTDNFMPDTAGGTFLDRWLALFALSRNGATQSSGVITPTYSITTGYTFVPTGAVLIDSVGLRYQVTIGGNYGPGNPGGGLPALINIPVQSIDAGSATDHINGDQLSWVTLVPFVASNANVGTSGGQDGLSGGNNSEVGNDEPPRQRLFARIQSPPGGGNWADVARWAQESTPDVQAAFVYPALLGPGTVFFAVVGAAQTQAPLSSTSKNRSLPAPLITGTVVPFVQGQYPARAAVVGTSAANQPADVALLLALPNAPTAQPAGPGGGWVDGTPWPSTGSLVGALQVPVVTAVTNSTNFQVSLAAGAAGPIAGVSHIAYIDPTNWTLYTATVVAASLSGVGPNVWNLTVDTPWPGITSGYFVFPQAVQQANYLAAALQGFANLGPGEWTTNAQILKRAFRHPSPALAWPYSLDANFLRTMENAGPEVATASFAFRSATTPTVPGTPTVTTTDPFTLTSAPPNILVPRNVGFYQS